DCPTCGQGTWFISRPRTSRASERRQGRWCWRSDVVQHRPCRPIRGLSAYRLDRDVDRQPLLFTEDIAMTSAVLVLVLSLPGQSPQAYPAAQAPAKVAPAPQAPSKVAPAPYAPSKVAPAPQAPSKIAPAPYAPSKVAPAPQAAAPYAPTMLPA